MTRVVIAAAGPQNKWGNHLGVPSHLVPVDGAPLLARTIAQARTLTNDVHLTCPDDPRYDLLGVVRHIRDASAPSEYAATRDLWNPDGRTILLLGDVYFTPNAITRISRYQHRRFQVFGRYRASKHTGTPYGEIFAVSWWPEHHPQMDTHLATVHALRAAGTITRPPGWMLLRAWQGTPLGKHRVSPRCFTEIDDLTDDMDCPADFARHPATRGEPVANVFTRFPATLARTRVEPRHIIHVGAHEGQEVPYYVQAGVEHVTLVEPIPELASRLRTEHPGVRVIDAACGTEVGPATLHIPARTNLASLADHGRSDTSPITVQVLPLAQLQADTTPAPNIAVIDAQGRELDVLASADLDALDMVIVETCTVDPTMASDYDGVVAHMGASGFVEVDRWVRDYDRVAAWAHGTKERRGGEIRDVVFVKKGLTMETTEAPDYENMLLADLRKAAHERGLPASGTKAELAGRLRAADAAPSDPAPFATAEKHADPSTYPTGDGALNAQGSGTVTATGPAWRAGPGAPDAPQKGSFFEVDLPAVKPSAVDEAWLLRCEAKVLRRALDAGRVPCGEVERMGQVDAKHYLFRVSVR